MSFGETDPDPHFKVEVVKDIWMCAVPACTEHVYDNKVQAFDFGPAVSPKVEG